LVLANGVRYALRRPYIVFVCFETSFMFHITS
jgi:hypothetical protein